uniref:Uncharacterized protein n=1 Tax=Anguilla anguilla TaxID=7936 RepID=A0A0E9WIA0_ANGAN
MSLCFMCMSTFSDCLCVLCVHVIVLAWGTFMLTWERPRYLI